MIIRVSDVGVIIRVKVVTGDALAMLDTTGKLTQKFQARYHCGNKFSELISANDTSLLKPFVARRAVLGSVAPIHQSTLGQLLPIRIVYNRLKSLLGETFVDRGHLQERNRGASLHELCYKALGYRNYQDDGQFPDIRHQLVEVKLQTSPTIDLGLVCPNSTEPLDVPQIKGMQIRHCDVRYVIFGGKTDGKLVTLTHLTVATGEDFFERFPQFGGKILNRKLQIPLPGNFFDI